MGDVLVSYEHNYRLLRKQMDAMLEDGKGPTLPYWGLFKRDCMFAMELNNNGDGQGQRKLDALMRQYNRYKEGKYAPPQFGHDQSVQTWLHHQLEETFVLSSDDIRRMSDNVRDFDERTSEKR